MRSSMVPRSGSNTGIAADRTRALGGALRADQLPVDRDRGPRPLRRRDDRELDVPGRVPGHIDARHAGALALVGPDRAASLEAALEPPGELRARLVPRGEEEGVSLETVSPPEVNATQSAVPS